MTSILITDDENFWILPFHKVNKFFYALPFAYTGRCDIKAAAIRIGMDCRAEPAVQHLAYRLRFLYCLEPQRKLLDILQAADAIFLNLLQRKFPFLCLTANP